MLIYTPCPLSALRKQFSPNMQQHQPTRNDHTGKVPRSMFFTVTKILEEHFKSNDKWFDKVGQHSMIGYKIATTKNIYKQFPRCENMLISILTQCKQIYLGQCQLNQNICWWWQNKYTREEGNICGWRRWFFITFCKAVAVVLYRSTMSYWYFSNKPKYMFSKLLRSEVQKFNI